MHRKPACARALEDNLEELKRRQLLEALRPYVLQSETEKNNKVPITLDDLKALCRIWKMDQRRNFWRLHPTQHDIVMALHEYISENMRYSTTLAVKSVAASTASRANITSRPPDYARHSKEASPRGKLPNYFGRKAFDREVDEKELAIRSRFYSFPQDTNDTAMNTLRIKVEQSVSPKKGHVVLTTSASTASDVSISKKHIQNLKDITRKSLDKEFETDLIRQKTMKHRTLAGHLVRFSARKDVVMSSLAPKAIKVFLTISISQDPLTVTRGLMGLSNIASDKYVRTVLNTDNALSTIASLNPSPEGQWFSVLLFYYWSVDADIEEFASVIFQVVKRVSTDNVEMRLLCLETLNNILPTPERHKAMELLMTTMSSTLEDTESMTEAVEAVLLTLLDIISNLCSFVNVHMTLLEYGILNIVSRIKATVEIHDLSIKHRIADVLLSLLQNIDLYTTLLQFTFIEYAMETLGTDDPYCLHTLLKSMAILSQNKVYANYMRTCALMEDLKTLMQTKPVNGVTKADYACVVSMLSNLCYFCPLEEKQPTGMSFLPLLVPLVQYYNLASIGRIALLSIENLLIVPELCEHFIAELIDPLSMSVELYDAIHAALSLFNMVLIPDCRTHLVDSGTHHLLFRKSIHDASASDFKCACLEVLMHLVKDERCLRDLMKGDVIQQLLRLSKGDPAVWLDMSRLLRILVSTTSIDEGNLAFVMQILMNVCSSDTDVAIIVECSMILAYLSRSVPDFQEMDSVIKAIITVSDDRSVMESLANLLFNVSSIATPSTILLEDSYYLDVMIKMMRSGSPTIQKDVGEAMRTLCSFEKCCQLLLGADLLQDFIVVALLLTTSPEIQYICNEAFCNLLSHGVFRLQLLKGDLCWAMMNICRNNGDAVRTSCGRAFYNLSCDRNYLPFLRKNLILSFSREISSNTENSTDVVRHYVLLATNLAMQLNRDMTPYELKYVNGVSIDALTLHTESDLCIPAIRLILKCCEVNLEYTLQEFVVGKYDELLTNTAHIWTNDNECIVDITRLFVLLSGASGFTQAVLWPTISRFFDTILQSNAVVQNEAMENMTICLYNYVVKNTEPLGMFDSFCAGSLVLHCFVATASKRKPFNEVVGSLLMYVIAFEVSGIIGRISELISTQVMQNILYSFSTYIDASTKNNMLIMVHACVSDNAASANLITAGLFKFLDQHILRAKGSTAKQRHVVSLFFVNLAVYLFLREQLVDAEAIDDLISSLVELGDETVHTHVLGGLFYLSNGYLSDSVRLTPKYVQSIAQAFLTNSREETHIRLARQIISIVLDKYSGAEGIHPSFVQSMFNDIQSPKGADVSDILVAIAHTPVVLEIALPTNIVGNPELEIFTSCNQVGFNAFLGIQVDWLTTSYRIRKLMDLELLKLISAATSDITATPKQYGALEIVQCPPCRPYKKVIKLYPKVFVEKDDGTSLTFVSIEPDVPKALSPSGVVSQETSDCSMRRASLKTSESPDAKQARRGSATATSPVNSRQRDFRRRSFMASVVINEADYLAYSKNIVLETDVSVNSRSSAESAAASIQQLSMSQLMSDSTPDFGSAIAFYEKRASIGAMRPRVIETLPTTEELEEDLQAMQVEKVVESVVVEVPRTLSVSSSGVTVPLMLSRYPSAAPIEYAQDTFDEEGEEGGGDGGMDSYESTLTDGSMEDSYRS